MSNNLYCSLATSEQSFINRTETERDDQELANDDEDNHPGNDQDGSKGTL